MIKKVVVLSRQWIERFIDQLKIIPDIEGGWAIISIFSSDILLNPKNIEILKKLGCHGHISLQFADVTKENYERAKDFYDEKNLYLFNEMHAKSILNFIDEVQKNDKIQTLVVHCSAGISRSGAIGLFASRYLHIDEKEFWKINPNLAPNSYVLHLLLETSGIKDDYIRFWEKLDFDPKNIF